MYNVKYDIDYKDFIDIRESVKWNKLNDEQIKKAINNSMINVSVYDDDKCVGVGRIVGDNILKGMFTDIMVRPEYQGKGVGRIVLTSLIDKLRDSINEGESFQLEASPTANNRDFYIKCGMKYKPENQDGVYIWLKKQNGGILCIVKIVEIN